jgi:hypothetical protein
LEECSKHLTKEEINHLMKVVINEKAGQVGLEALLKLYFRSDISDDLYPYIDTFIELLDSKDSVKRSRAIFMVSINAKWDKENKIDKNIDKFLSHVEDEKSIISRQCIKCLQNIIPYKRNLKEKIENKLRSINYNSYTENMKELLFEDVTEVLKLYSA